MKVILVHVNVIDGEMEDMGIDSKSTSPLYFREDRLDGFLEFKDYIMFYVNGQEHVTNYSEETREVFKNALLQREVE